MILNNLIKVMSVFSVLVVGASANAQVKFCKKPGLGLVLPVNSYQCKIVKGEAPDEEDAISAVSFDQLAPGAVGFTVTSVDGKVSSYKDAEGVEGYSLVFADGNVKEFPIGDAGIDAVVLSDSCAFGQVQKTVHTILAPNKNLEFPLVDGRVVMTQRGAGFNLEYFIPHIQLKEGEKLTQEVLDSAPFELFLAYECTPSTQL